MNYILIDGEPVLEPDILKFGRWMQDNDAARSVAKTEVADGVLVSTVFLGIDHRFGSGKPLLWETMVFGGVLDGKQERYTLRAHAENGHAEMVEKVRTVQSRAAIPEGERCQRCKKARSEAEHTCPFAEEIHDRHDLCNCCAECTHECCMDI